MLVPVGVLAVGATLVGWLAGAGRLARRLELARAGRRRRSSSSRRTRRRRSRASSRRRSRPGRHRRRLVDLRRAPPAGAGSPSPALEHKFWFDELYDAVFYRPGGGAAKPLYALRRGPLVGGSIDGHRRGRARRSARRLDASRPGSSAPTRSSSRPASPSSSSSSWRCANGQRVADRHADPAAARRRRSSSAIAPLPRLAAGLVALARQPGRDRVLGRRAERVRLHPARRCSSQDSDDLVRRPRLSYHVGFTGFSLWLVGLTAIALTAAIAYALWVGRDRAAPTSRSMLLPDGARSSASSRPRTTCSSTSSGRRC